MNPGSIVERLREGLTERSAASAAAVAAALRVAERTRFPNPKVAGELHELVLFARAYPANREIAALAEAILRGFAKRTGGDVGAALEEADISGIAGTGLTAVFTESTARYLARKYPKQVRVAWEAWEGAQRLGLVLREAIPLAGDDAEVEPHPPYREWVAEVSGGGSKELAWLVDHTRGQFDLLEVPLRWEVGTTRATRSVMRLRDRRIFYHDGALISRREVDLKGLASAPPLPLRRLSRREGQAMLDLARETLAVRYRELHGYLWGDPASVVEADAGRGVRFYFSTVMPEHRLPLRSYLGATLWKNGVPAGYFEGLTFFERMEAGFNLFYTFRAGETAWIYRQLLAACHQITGARSFVLDPYQIGHENEEGIESGAFWFYRKLGYRSVVPALRELTAREERRAEARPGYRSAAATLRRLARSPLIFEMEGSSEGEWDCFELRRLGFAVARLAARRFEGDTARMNDECAAWVARVAGFSTGSWQREELSALARISPLLRLVPGIAGWSSDEFALLEKVIRSKAGPDENRHLRLTQRHARLRSGLLRLGCAGVK